VLKQVPLAFYSKIEVKMKNSSSFSELPFLSLKNIDFIEKLCYYLDTTRGTSLRLSLLKFLALI
jgi:hypothetical protein